MNERIRELAARAGFDWALKRSSLYSHDDDKQNLEKFAELIVRQCAEIADKAEPYKANDLIKQHFGVEE
jgi:hypothetical protein